MARTRDTTSSFRHHVLNRGVDGQDIFGIPDDRAFLEAMIERLVTRYDVEVHAYAWMTNHIHLLVDLTKTTPEALSHFMRDLQGAYAEMFNARTERRGPLFQSRFVNVAISDDAHYLTVARYVHKNPVAIVGTKAVAAYEYSSLPVYLGRRPAPRWLTTARLSSMIVPERHLESIRRVEAHDYLPAGGCPPLARTTARRLECAVAAATSGLIRSHETTRLVADLHAEFALSLRVADVVELADAAGVTPQAIRRRAARAKIRLAEDPMFVQLRDRVFDELTGRD